MPQRQVVGKKEIHRTKRRLGSMGGAARGSTAPHALLGIVHSDTAINAPVRGAMVLADSTPEWNALPHPAGAGFALVTDATDVMWDQTPTWTGRHTWNDGADRAYIDQGGGAWFTGPVLVGVDDITKGQLQLYGAATGSDEGGELILYTAEDYDTTIEFYVFDADQDDVRLWPNTVAWIDTFTAEGQLQLSMAGAAGGILIGGDAQWYRSAADMLSTPDNVTIETRCFGFLKAQDQHGRIGNGPVEYGEVVAVGGTMEIAPAAALWATVTIN